MAAFRYYLHSMITLPITEKSKQEEWRTILTIANSNGYPVNTINNLKTKLMFQETKTPTIPHDNST